MSAAPSPTTLLQHLFDHVPTWEYGALGAANAHRLAAGALQAASRQPALAHAGIQMTLTGWYDAPLDTRLTRLLAGLNADTGCLAPHAPLDELVQALAPRCAVPADFSVLDALPPPHGNNADAACAALLDCILPRLADPAHGGFWLGAAMHWCLTHGNALQANSHADLAPDLTPDLAPDVAPDVAPDLSPELAPDVADNPHAPDTSQGATLSREETPSRPRQDTSHATHPVLERLLAAFPPLPGYAALCARLRAGWLLVHGTFEAAHRALAQPMQGFEPWQQLRTAELLARHGAHKEAARLLFPLWQAQPAHPNLILALHQLLFPVAPAPADTPPPAILIYSWNKAAVLAQSLQSLRASHLRGARIFALDNGSTDDTAHLLRTTAASWGSPFEVVSLPVNVGAPAARNWLLSLPAVKAHSHAVFLDDDVLLPPHWLDHLMGVAHATPQAGTIGCRITDHTAPFAVQCADFFALAPDMGQRSFADLTEQLFIHGNASNSTDTLLTAHTRPCLSVSGCCHMLRMDVIAQCGAFDVRFTPSQFDDLEHDLRATLAGHPTWYAGGLQVRHMQHSSLRQATSRSKNAHIFGNRIKLEHLYPAPKVRQLHETTSALARQDLLRKASQLAAIAPEDI